MRRSQVEKERRCRLLFYVSYLENSNTYPERKQNGNEKDSPELSEFDSESAGLTEIRLRSLSMYNNIRQISLAN